MCISRLVRRAGRSLNVLCTFNLRFVLTGTFLCKAPQLLLLLPNFCLKAVRILITEDRTVFKKLFTGITDDQYQMTNCYVPRQIFRNH